MMQNYFYPFDPEYEAEYLAEIPEYADENEYLLKSSEYQTEHESMLAYLACDGNCSGSWEPVMIPENLYDVLVTAMKDFENPLDFIRLFGGEDLLRLLSDDPDKSSKMLGKLFLSVHTDCLYWNIHAPDLLPDYDDRRDIHTILHDYWAHLPNYSEVGDDYE